MLRKSREEILKDFKAQIAQGKILVGVGAGTGITAKCSEAADVDILIIYNSGRYRMAGRGSLAGLLSYGDANAIVQEMGCEVLPIVKKTPVLAGVCGTDPIVKKTPVLAGVCGTDPFRVMDLFLKQLKDQGFNGVQNFPTVGLIDGKFRANLEETGMGYGLEVEMVREAHKLDMLTCPCVFDPEQAKAMAEAGADILVAHMGLTTKGSIGAETAGCGRQGGVTERPVPGFQDILQRLQSPLFGVLAQDDPGGGALQAGIAGLEDLFRGSMAFFSTGSVPAAAHFRSAGSASR